MEQRLSYRKGQHLRNRRLAQLRRTWKPIQQGRTNPKWKFKEVKRDLKVPCKEFSNRVKKIEKTSKEEKKKGLRGTF